MLAPEAIRQLADIAGVPMVSGEVLERFRSADEREQLEPALMRIMGEPSETPHGPTEVADLITDLEVIGEGPRLAAVVIKGRASKKVRVADVGHQLLKAAQVPGLGLLVFAAVGDIQDDVKTALGFLGDRVDWLVLDRLGLARLLVAYGEICPRDGSWLADGSCSECPYVHGTVSRVPVPDYLLLSLEDVSWALARRYSAKVLLRSKGTKAETEDLIPALVDDLRREDYSRNEMVAHSHRGRLADVVYFYLYNDIAQVPVNNWFCRGLFVRGELKEIARPHGFGEPMSQAPEISLDWSRNRDLLETFFAGRRTTKGTYLGQLDRFMAMAPELVERARALLRADGSPETIDRELSRLSREIESLPGLTNSGFRLSSCRGWTKPFTLSTQTCSTSACRTPSGGPRSGAGRGSCGWWQMPSSASRRTGRHWSMNAN